MKHIQRDVSVFTTAGKNRFSNYIHLLATVHLPDVQCFPNESPQPVR